MFLFIRIWVRRFFLIQHIKYIARTYVFTFITLRWYGLSWRPIRGVAHSQLTVYMIFSWHGLFGTFFFVYYPNKRWFQIHSFLETKSTKTQQGCKLHFEFSLRTILDDRVCLGKSKKRFRFDQVWIMNWIREINVLQ